MAAALRLLALACLCALLVACGGGGDDPPCAEEPPPPNTQPVDCHLRPELCQ